LINEKSEDDVVSFENFGKLNKSRNEEKIDEGTLGAGELINDIENISERSKSEKALETQQENDSENLPIFGH
jgi:hypothetical protein